MTSTRSGHPRSIDDMQQPSLGLLQSPTPLRIIDAINRQEVKHKICSLASSTVQWGKHMSLLSSNHLKLIIRKVQHLNWHTPTCLTWLVEHWPCGCWGSTHLSVACAVHASNNSANRLSNRPSFHVRSSVIQSSAHVTVTETCEHLICVGVTSMSSSAPTYPVCMEASLVCRGLVCNSVWTRAPSESGQVSAQAVQVWTP